MIALFHRERTGEGREIESGMFETMAAFMLVEHANGAMFSPPLGLQTYPRAVAPQSKTLPDQRLPYLRTGIQRQAAVRLHRRRPAGMGWANASPQDWLDLLRSLDIPAASFRTLGELFENAHLNEVEFVETVDAPNGPSVFSWTADLVLKNSRSYRRPGPRLGAHTTEIATQRR